MLARDFKYIVNNLRLGHRNKQDRWGVSSEEHEDSPVGLFTSMMEKRFDKKLPYVLHDYTYQYSDDDLVFFDSIIEAFQDRIIFHEAKERRAIIEEARVAVERYYRYLGGTANGPKLLVEIKDTLNPAAVFTTVSMSGGLNYYERDHRINDSYADAIPLEFSAALLARGSDLIGGKHMENEDKPYKRITESQRKRLHSLHRKYHALHDVSNRWSMFSYPLIASIYGYPLGGGLYEFREDVRESLMGDAKKVYPDLWKDNKDLFHHLIGINLIYTISHKFKDRVDAFTLFYPEGRSSTAKYLNLPTKVGNVQC